MHCPSWGKKKKYRKAKQNLSQAFSASNLSQSRIKSRLLKQLQGRGEGSPALLD